MREVEKQFVVVVDPWSTGCCVAQEFSKRGYNLIRLWSHDMSDGMKDHVPTSCAKLRYVADVEERTTMSETARAVREVAKACKIVACLSGGESGVRLADALSEHLGIRTNGADVPQRRNKQFQQDVAREAGLRSVRQAAGTEFSDVEEFLKTERYPLVVKPVDSCASFGVKLCHSFDEAKEHFHIIQKTDKIICGEETSVVCQEFLRGKEYVIDHVSRDGVHKTVMIWVYDKRPANGCEFVYFGMVPVDSESLEAKLLIPYTRAVLDGLGVKNGPTHGEVIMTEDGPCLVEINCRTHGGDGSWIHLARSLTGGYSQVDATADLYLDEEKFRMLPDKPTSPFKALGQEMILLSFSKGTVKQMPGFDIIKKLPSFICLETPVIAGSEVNYTTDFFTNTASVILTHNDEGVVKKDVNFIRYMEKLDALFVYGETDQVRPKRPRGDVFSPATSANEEEGPLVQHLIPSDRPLLKKQASMEGSLDTVLGVDPYSTGTCIEDAPCLILDVNVNGASLPSN